MKYLLYIILLCVYTVESSSSPAHSDHAPLSPQSSLSSTDSDHDNRSAVFYQENSGMKGMLSPLVCRSNIIALPSFPSKIIYAYNHNMPPSKSPFSPSYT